MNTAMKGKKNFKLLGSVTKLHEPEDPDQNTKKRDIKPP